MKRKLSPMAQWKLLTPTQQAVEILANTPLARQIRRIQRLNQHHAKPVNSDEYSGS
jgi:predicted Fe-S protein YdhL (DUF1289 family)